jgi:hypothetical protein
MVVRRGVALVAACVLAVAACGGDDDDDSAATTGAPAGTTGSAATSATGDGGDPTPATVAAEISAAGLGCDDLEAEDPSDTAVTLAPEPPGQSASCTAKGLPVEITVFDDKAAADMATEQIDTVIKEVLKSVDIKELQFARAGPDGRVLVGVNSTDPESTEWTDEQRALTADIASAIGGEVVTIKP